MPRLLGDVKSSSGAMCNTVFARTAYLACYKMSETYGDSMQDMDCDEDECDVATEDRVRPSVDPTSLSHLLLLANVFVTTQFHRDHPRPSSSVAIIATQRL